MTALQIIHKHRNPQNDSPVHLNVSAVVDPAS